jgi:hypothetical protein
MSKTSSILEVTNKNGILKVKNPRTGRWCGVGSQTFKSLVKDQILNVEHWESNQVIYAGPNAKEIVKGLNPSSMGIPASKTVYVKNDKIMTRNKRVSREEVNAKMKELTMEVFKENPAKFKGLTPDEVVELVNKLVMERMVSGGNNSIKQKMMYIAENIYSDEEETDGEEEEYSYSDDEEVEIPERSKAGHEEGQEEVDEEVDEEVEIPERSKAGQEEDPLEGIGQLDSNFKSLVEEIEDAEIEEKMSDLKLENSYDKVNDGEEKAEEKAE